MELGDLGAELSVAAERLYEQILTAGESPAQDGPAERELVEAGLVCYGGEGDRLLRPVSRRHGMQILLSRQHTRLVEAQARALESWHRFTGLLTSGEAAPAEEFPLGVEPVRTLGDAATRARELYGSGNVLLRTTHTAAYQNQPTERRLMLPPDGSRAEVRAIYDAEFDRAVWGRRIIEESILAGEQVRIRAIVPTKMVHVDDRVALVAVRSDAGQAIVVTAPDLLALLADWFDLMWHDPTTTRRSGDEDVKLADMRRKVLHLMSLGRTDQQIARECGIVVGTVRRHIQLVKEELGVETRFAAGAAAVRRGWI
jgi:DNA-binding NarL/FixJ family response regulator